MVQDQLANKERYSKAPELALWATENEGDGRAYSDPFEPQSRFPSVTTVLKLVEKSALVGWAARKVAEKAIERWMDMGRDPEQLMKWLPFAHNAYRDDRGWVGSGLHAAIDADCKGEWFVHELNDEQEAMFAQWEHAKAALMIRVRLSEFTVRIGDTMGTADLLIEISEDFGDTWETLIVDTKGLPLDTRIPTPSGWSTMGELEVGDLVFASNGKSYPVISKSEVHHNPCYEITFDNGETVIADEDHRWAVTIGSASSSSDVVMTTRQIAARPRGKNGQRDVRILNASPIETPRADLPIDPYVLGVWLGDGTTGKPEITVNDTTKSGIKSEIQSRGWKVEERVYPSDSTEWHGVRLMIGDMGRPRHPSPFKARLEELGVLNSKHIPNTYLRASIEQRTDLLRGLMDTDGGWNPVRGNECRFTGTDKNMRDQFSELASSLGLKVYNYDSPATWTYLGVKKWTTAYGCSFQPSAFSPFLAREYPLKASSRLAPRNRRLVKSVNPTDMVPTQCIEVGSPDHTYLFGETMIVTHNTSRNIWPEHKMQLGILSKATHYFEKVPEGTPGAALHKYADPETKKQVKTYWLKKPMPHFDGAAILHIREDSWELIRVNNLDLHAKRFDIYRQDWDLKKELKDLGD